MDRPAVDRVDGVPPAIAIDQTNPCAAAAARSHDDRAERHLKLLYARAAQLFDRQTAQSVRHDSPRRSTPSCATHAEADPRLVSPSPVELPPTQRRRRQQWLPPAATHACSGREWRRDRAAQLLDVVPTVRLQGTEKVPRRGDRSALKRAAVVNVYVLAADEGEPQLLALLGPACTVRQRPAHADPQPALFSFNSAYGACEPARLRRGSASNTARDPRRPQDLARRRDQADADTGLEGLPGRLLKYAGEAGIPRDTA